MRIAAILGAPLPTGQPSAPKLGMSLLLKMSGRREWGAAPSNAAFHHVPVHLKRYTTKKLAFGFVLFL
jgi:hypothetical protein